MVRCRDIEHLKIINYALLLLRGWMSGGIWWALRMVGLFDERNVVEWRVLRCSGCRVLTHGTRDDNLHIIRRLQLPHVNTQLILTYNSTHYHNKQLTPILFDPQIRTRHPEHRSTLHSNTFRSSRIPTRRKFHQIRPEIHQLNNYNA
jgi:hypothetical protein